MRRILGIDQARTTGWCVWDQKSDSTSWGIWKLKGANHAIQMEQLLDEIIAQQPTTIGCEAPMWSRAINRKGAEFRLKLIAMIELASHRLDAPLQIYHPATIKKWLTGYGRADKSQMIQHIARRFDIITDDDNVADAAAIMYMTKENFNVETSSGNKNKKR